MQIYYIPIHLSLHFNLFAIDFDFICKGSLLNIEILLFFKETGLSQGDVLMQLRL